MLSLLLFDTHLEFSLARYPRERETLNYKENPLLLVESLVLVARAFSTLNFD